MLLLNEKGFTKVKTLLGGYYAWRQAGGETGHGDERQAGAPGTAPPVTDPSPTATQKTAPPKKPAPRATTKPRRRAGRTR